MLRKDYIQRQLEEFGKVLATLLTLRKNKDWQAFEKEIEEATQKFTSLELTKLEAMNEGDFKKELATHPLPFDQKKILANLLFEKMTAYQERDEQEKYLAIKVKCFDLYLELSTDLTQNQFDMETHYRLEILRRPE